MDLTNGSWRCLTKITLIFRFAVNISFGHLKDVLARCLACLNKTSLRHLADVFLPAGHGFTQNLRNFLLFLLFLKHLFPRTLFNGCFEIFKKFFQQTNIHSLVQAYRSSHLQMFYKYSVLKSVSKFTGKWLCRSLFLIKLQTSTQLLSCEFREMFKNTLFLEHLRCLLLKLSIAALGKGCSGDNLCLTFVETCIWLEKYCFISSRLRCSW